MGRRIGALLALLTYASCGQAQPSRPPPAPPTHSPAPPPRVFDASSVVPSETVRAVRQALESDPQEARARLAEALAEADPREAGRLRWLLARAAAAAGDSEAERAQLRALGESDHPLAPWATLRLAESLADDDPAAAAELAATQIGYPWAGRAQARRVHARALLATGDEAAVDLLRELVAEAPAHIGAASAAFPLAEHLARSEDAAAREEALALFRRIASRAPKARIGAQAAARAAEVLASLPAERRRALTRPSTEDLFARADALYGAMHHAEAEAAYAELARRLRDDDAARCRALLGQGKAMLRRRRRAEGAEHMRAVAEGCADSDVRAWARYKAGRAYAQTGDRARALAQYEALLREAPEHRLADDAVFWAALTQMYAGDTEDMVARLRTLVERYPDGDMVGEGLFRLAMHARAEGQHAEALRWLARAADGTGEETEDLHGRAAYWRARTLQALGRGEEAQEAFAALARRWPLSYYAQQALQRLRELDDERASAVLAAMRAERAVETFPWVGAMDEPWFARFVELAAVGELELADRELAASPDRDALVWVAAAVYAGAGALPKVTRLVRRRHAEFRALPPVGDAWLRWRLAYPRAFWPLIEDTATGPDVPASFVRAIAREESSFNPRAVSWAHAYGLVQLILPTARRFGRDLDVPIDARTLRDPEVNLAVGTRYMRYLRDRYANPGLVPAAYNAGHGAVDRWLRERGHLPFDEFVERIPYDETRRYTRRVLQTWGVYAWLDEGRLPEIPARLR